MIRLVALVDRTRCYPRRGYAFETSLDLERAVGPGPDQIPPDERVRLRLISRGRCVDDLNLPAKEALPKVRRMLWDNAPVLS